MQVTFLLSSWTVLHRNATKATCEMKFSSFSWTLDKSTAVEQLCPSGSARMYGPHVASAMRFSCSVFNDIPKATHYMATPREGKRM